MVTLTTVAVALAYLAALVAAYAFMYAVAYVVACAVIAFGQVALRAAGRWLANRVARIKCRKRGVVSNVVNINGRVVA